MAIQRIFYKKVVLPNTIYRDKYWPFLSKLVHDKIGDKEVKDPSLVQEILKKCFSKLCSILEELIQEEKRTSFYIFSHNIHEDSLDLFTLQLRNIPLGINEEDFAASRRILKIILEQSTKLDLLGTPNFFLEIRKNLNEYTDLLEEMMYVGSWCFIISENIARSQLFPKSIGVQIIDTELNILTYQPYPELFKYVFQDIPRHNARVALSDSITEFKTLVEENYGVSYDQLASFLRQQLVRPEYRLGITKIEPLIKEINDHLDCNSDFVKSFYKGLTVNRDNCLSIEECFYRNQDENRHIFRPILEIIVDEDQYNIIGFNKWLESLSLLTTNCFPFGLYPSEWKNFPELKKFINNVNNTHDKILENPVIDMLNAKSIYHDSNVESFVKSPDNNINIKNTVGDLDIIFLDIPNEIIYVCECKHNRSRTDMNNWKRDYSKFKDQYEAQLKRKVDWTKANKNLIESHFKNKYSKDFDKRLEKFNVLGVFIINAPTIYMYNGKFRAFTITDMQEILDGNYLDIKFEYIDEKTKEKIVIEYPYFDNVEEKF